MSEGKAPGVREEHEQISEELVRKKTPMEHQVEMCDQCLLKIINNECERCMERFVTEHVLAILW